MILTRATKAASRAQQRYEMSIDQNIRQISAFEEDDLVFLDINSSVASKQTHDTSQKLWAKKKGPYKIITVQSKTVTV